MNHDRSTWPVDASTLVNMLRHQATAHGNTTAYTFLGNEQTDETPLTYAALDQQARTIAAWLQRQGAHGDRVLLLYPPGLEYIAAFFGCLYAGTIAVPAYPPRFNRSITRLQGIIADAQATMALTTSKIQANVLQHVDKVPELAALQWYSTDATATHSPDEWQSPALHPDTLAFLQYTSGSTGQPKGVMLSHANLLYNLSLLDASFQTHSPRRGVSWLPPYHDMGLISGVLLPIYTGIPTTLMSPATFLQRPLRWLQAITRTGATISGAPNFAYDLCVDRSTPEQRAELDLSSWQIAPNGAEPVRHETLERFAAAFAPAGFRREAFDPVYGLAEATLIVSGGRTTALPTVAAFSDTALEQHRVVVASEDTDGGNGSRTLVGCGQTMPGQEIRIVDPDTCQECRPDQVGEIWVRGPSVAQGYWNRQQETEYTFQARIVGAADQGPFLRTGDLGFLRDGELFVTGRLKDLIIIRGRNHYPQDIEATVAQSSPVLRLDFGAAFSLMVDGSEQLVIVQEIDRQYRSADFTAAFAAITQAIAEQHDLQVERICLLKHGSIPKTSSGKIQRHACRNSLLDGTLEIVAEWRRDSVAAQPAGAGEESRASSSKTVAELRAWLTAQLATRLNLAPQMIDHRTPFASFGIDSAAAISLSGELETWLDRSLSPTLVYEYPTIDALAHYLADEPLHDSPAPVDQARGEHEPLAIIGMGCRMPGATDIHAFWQLLRDGVDAIREVPPERRDIWAASAAGAAVADKLNTRWGGFLEQVGHFDASFFGISPRETVQMDPQQRLLLEVTWEALEHARQIPDQLAGSPVGVFIGSSSSDYGRLHQRQGSALDAYIGTGNALSIIANRVSYLFDFRGPSMTVDTACSSSLVALHLACESLRRGESQLALAGGVNLTLTPDLTIAFSQARMMAADGRCKTFDAAADGYVRGEGCGVVVLKRLRDAVRDGDEILAVVRGTAVNQDGRSNGLTAPNGQAQQRVIRQALDNAELLPSQIGYVEMHGTGTPLGDPIEFQALASVLQQDRPADQPCVIGSVKTNIGHLEAAAGIAGVIKVVLALKQQEIPPHLHLTALNPYIDMANSPLRIATERHAWPRGSSPRFAGISSFGFGGTNAHVIIAEGLPSGPALEEHTTDRPRHLLALGAKSESALRALAQRYVAMLTDESPLADICFSANTTRSKFATRLTVVASSAAELRAQLSAYAAGQQPTGLIQGVASDEQRPKIAFLFTGQGSHYPAMARHLYATQPTFRQALDRCAALLDGQLPQPLLTVFDAEGAALLNQTRYAQPTLFALEYALAQMWQSWGVMPDMVLGHSVGEYAAACLAGVFSLEDGLQLMVERGRLMQADTEPGMMAVVFAERALVEQLVASVREQVAIAAYNGPENIVVSGERGAVEVILAQLHAAEIETRILPVTQAFHSPQIEPALDALAHVIDRIALSAPSLPLISNLTGQPLEAGYVPDSSYWRSHAREPVQFMKGVQTLAQQGCTIFVEIGPGSTLLGASKRSLPQPGLSWLPSLKRDSDDWSILLHSLGVLYVQGAAIDWAAFDRDYPRQRVDVPTYPFEREFYWIAPGAADTAGVSAPTMLGRHPLLGARVRSPLPVFQFESQLSAQSPAFLTDHRVQGITVMPGTGYMMMALAATEEAFGPGTVELTDVSFREAFFLPDGEVSITQLVLTPEPDGTSTFQVLSLPGSRSSHATDWTVHATGTVRRDQPTDVPDALTVEQLGEIQARCQQRIDGAEHYRQLHGRGLHYGPTFQGVVQIMRRDGEALGQIELAASLHAEADTYPIHPALLDACIQMLAHTPPAEMRAAGEDTYLPVAIAALRIYRRPAARLWCYTTLLSEADPASGTFVGDVRLLDETGVVVAEMLSLRVQSLSAGIRRSEDTPLTDLLYDLEWQPQPRALLHEEITSAASWLILADQCGVAQHLQQHLAARGISATTIHPDQLDPAQPEAWRQLLAQVQTGSQPCHKIVYLWGLDTATLDTITYESLAQAQQRGCEAVLGLAQVLGEQGAAAPQLWIVTQGAQPVVGDQRSLAITQAPLWGFGRSMALEHPQCWGGLIDIEAGVEPDLAALVDTIAAPTDENQIAFRAGQRYVARLVRSAQPPEQSQPLALRADSTYLITGGLGGLGLQVAHWMVQRGARRLVLLGRSGLPDRGLWEHLPPDHPAVEQIRAVQALEQLGATIVALRADVADMTQMRAVFADLRQQMPPVRGVIHAAGLANPSSLRTLDLADMRTVLRPKVLGAWVLHALTQELSLDFFVSFSSISAVWGSRELAHYAAANQFLEALAVARQAWNMPALSVSWGPWAGSGMAATDESSRALRLSGLRPLPPSQALAALTHLLEVKATQRTVVDASWTTFTTMYGAKSSAQLFAQVHDRVSPEAELAVPSPTLTRLAVLPPAERLTHLIDGLRAQVAGVLRLEPERLDIAQPLNTLGLDSLMAVELKNGIETSLGVKLSMVTLLQGPSIAQLADTILEQMDDHSPAAVPVLRAIPVDPNGEEVLSLGQQALWFLHQLAPHSSAYNIVGASRIRSAVDVDALRRAFQRLTDRQPSLRTTFTAVNGTPMQRVAAHMEVSFQVENAAGQTQDELHTRLINEAHRPFDLEQGPLFRVHLYTRSETEHIMLLAVHHTIADFWSLVVIIHEVGLLYPAERAGTAAQLPPLEVQYTDYARWQAEMLRGPEGERLWSYWRGQLSPEGAGELPALNLPTDYVRPAVQTYHGASQTLALDAALTTSLKALSETHRTTLYTVLLSAFQVLLHRYTSQDDILVGSPIAGRVWPEVAGVIGYFVSPVVMRGNFAGDPSFAAVLGQMRQTVLDALEHQQYPLALLVERLKPVRDPSRSPLFQVMFILQKAHLLNDEGVAPFVLRETGAQMDLGGLTLESLSLEQRVAQFDLTLMMVEANGGLAASLEYNTDLFAAPTIQRMLGHFHMLLEGIVVQPERPLSTLPLLTAAERGRLLVALNETHTSYPQHQCLHELVADQAERTPDAVAVVAGDDQLTYAQLDQRANQLARYLQTLGVGPDVLVALCIERGLELIVGLLGVLKAGGAYVPLDPAYPAERIRFVLEDSQAPVLLTQRALQPNIPAAHATVVCVDSDWPMIAQSSPQPPTATATADHLAYVIYTSGSLGRPKGVQIEHRAVVNFMHAMRHTPGLTAQDCLVAVTTISFDIAALEMFLPLITGARLIIASREVATDGVRLSSVLDESGATVMQATPATWRLLLQSGWQGRPDLRILCGGEALPSDLAAALVPRSAALWNMYGPTETTIWSTAQHISVDQQRVAIGRPIANTQLYLLDAAFEPVPLGVPGQLWIGGDGLARGYLNRPDLTADKFRPNPFATRAAEDATVTPGERLYQTGDLARYLPDGTLEFLGRIDHQVKVRGFRIELGEIETLLRQHEQVQEAVVVAQEDGPGNNRLIAYIVAAAEATLTVTEVRSALRDQLPEYMIPTVCLFLPELPRTPNGKIDRKALPQPEGLRPELEAPYTPPQTQLELLLATIWREVLQVEQIGIHDNFFDLGGHSLLTAQVHSRLRAALGRELSIVELFKYPTIGALAGYLGQTQEQPPTFHKIHERIAAYRAAVQQPAQTTDLAIVGMAARFPGAANVETFWTNIRDGIESIRTFSDEELRDAGVDPALLNNPQYVKAVPALEGVELFDAAFFGFSPREAELIDPQHRLFLTCAWEALEHAGYNTQTYDGQIGVYGGAGMNTYLLNNLMSNRQLTESVSDFETMISSDKDFLTTRVSYLLNLRGPSVNVQSACSTSLVAVTLACQSLLTHQCDMALAGGVSIRVPQTGYLYQEEGIRSPDGHCRSFDAQAQGTLFGSGVGVVVLKRLSDALRDGDLIHAVVKGATINNDGAQKVGYTAPGVEGQAAVIAEALLVAGVEAQTISYVEAHGTATALGDPIEVAALTEAFRSSTDARGFCALGSVKTNVGHLDAAAGVAGLIKTTQALKHRQIPPSLHFEQPNPQINFASTPFYVNNKLIDWAAGDTPRRAGVSALGIGGTNAHVILEEPPAVEASGPSRPWQLLFLSAKTATALEAATTNLADYLRQHPDQPLADVAYTLHLGRRMFNHRRMLVCRDLPEAIAALDARDPQRVVTYAPQPGTPRVAFMFPGGGTQYVMMGMELYQEEPVFRAAIDRCAELLQPHLDSDLRTYLYPSTPTDEHRRRLEQPSLALPALFATEYALAQLWIAWGVEPNAMIGHSLGEYTAACLAGVLTLADALALVALRGRLFEQLPAGAMLSVPLSEADIAPLLDAEDTRELSLAAVNASSLCVVSGPRAAIDALREQLTQRGVETQRLHIDVAAHSAMLTPILAAFGAFVRTITLHPPQRPYISNVSGTWITAAEATDPEYWVRHLRQTVHFGAGVRTLLQEPDQILLEVGPGQALSMLSRQAGSEFAGRVILSSMRRHSEQQSDQWFLLNTLGQLALTGIPIRWSELYQGQRRQRLPLPTYPFEPQRYWIEPQPMASTEPQRRARLDKTLDPADWGYVPIWKQSPPVVRHVPEVDPSTAWLIFSDGGELSTALTTWLKQTGRPSVVVWAGAGFAETDVDRFTIDPACADDYEALFQELGRRSAAISKIIHAWSVTPPDQTTDSPLDRQQALGFYSLLYLVQALGKQEHSTPLELSVIASSTYEIIGGDGQRPVNATLAGPVRVIPQEYPHITCRIIDVVLPSYQTAAEAWLLDQLMTELATPASDLVVAYRGRQRWVQDVIPLRLDPAPVTPPTLRERGVYLITGGLGGVGLTLAEHLAATVQARLVLLGRSAFPSADTWDEWLATHDEDNTTCRTIEQLRRLEAHGAEVLVVSADVADERQMQAALEQATARFGPIQGVIHAAGLAAGGMLQVKTAASAAAVLAPKVQGTLVLTRLLSQCQLDFIVLCSSISSMIGSLGQIDHCAANAFLDAWAQQSTTRTIAINWPAWQDVGQAANAALPAELRAWRAEQLKQGISAQEGMEVFRRVLQLRPTQIIISPQDFDALAQHSRTLTAAAYLAALEDGQAVATRHERPLLRTAYIAPRNEIEERLAAIWSQFLGVEQIGIHDNFFELGGHSLLATQIVSRIRETFQVELSLRRLLEAPTVGDIALEIVQQRSAQTDDALMAQLLGELEELSTTDVEMLLVEDTSLTEPG